MSVTSEEQYKKELADNGVEVPEAEADKPSEEEAPAKEVPAEKPEAEEKSEELKDKEEPAPLQDEPKEPRKRSIYDDYKEKKQEAKTFQSLAMDSLRALGVELKGTENAEELQQKLAALGKAETPAEKKEAGDEFEAFAKKINADPAAIREMRDLFLKDYKPDESLKQGLDRFLAWEKQNASVIEKSMFEDEFQRSTPKLKELFPDASPEELGGAIKTELDKLAHTKEWHDKSLAYVAFENKETLSALISPKKRGMESGRKQDAEAKSSDFNPEADYASMTPKEREEWEAAYKGLTNRGTGLATGANGKKLLT